MLYGCLKGDCFFKSFKTGKNKSTSPTSFLSTIHFKSNQIIKNHSSSVKNPNQKTSHKGRCPKKPTTIRKHPRNVTLILKLTPYLKGDTFSKAYHFWYSCWMIFSRGSQPKPSFATVIERVYRVLLCFLLKLATFFVVTPTSTTGRSQPLHLQRCRRLRQGARRVATELQRP